MGGQLALNCMVESIFSPSDVRRQFELFYNLRFIEI